MRKHSSFKTILSKFPEKSSIDHLNCIKWCYVNGYARSAEENEPLDRAFDRMALPVAASMLAGASLAHYTSFSLLPKRHSVLQSVFSAAIAVSLAERKIFDRVFDRIALPDAAHTPEPASPSRKPETHACPNGWSRRAATRTSRSEPPHPGKTHDAGRKQRVCVWCGGGGFLCCEPLARTPSIFGRYRKPGAFLNIADGESGRPVRTTHTPHTLPLRGPRLRPRVRR